MDALIPPDLPSWVNTYLDRIGEHDRVARVEAQALAASRPEIAQWYRERTSRETAADENASPEVYLVSHPDRATHEKIPQPVPALGTRLSEPSVIQGDTFGRHAALGHLGRMPHAGVQEVAALAESYYAHHWSCPACQEGTVVGANLHRLCPGAEDLWRRYREAAGREVRPWPK